MRSRFFQLDLQTSRLIPVGATPNRKRRFVAQFGVGGGGLTSFRSLKASRPQETHRIRFPLGPQRLPPLLLRPLDVLFPSPYFYGHFWRCCGGDDTPPRQRERERGASGRVRDGRTKAESEQPISALGESDLTFSANQRRTKNKEPERQLQRPPAGRSLLFWELNRTGVWTERRVKCLKYHEVNIHDRKYSKTHHQLVFCAPLKWNFRLHHLRAASMPEQIWEGRQYIPFFGIIYWSQMTKSLCFTVICSPFDCPPKHPGLHNIDTC